TCLACVALHGTILEVGERVDDHDSGRCIGIPMLAGRGYDVQTGAEWFDGLDESQQQDMMGNAAYAAYQARDVSLEDFAQKTTEDLGGGQIREASLRGILEEAAKDYYGS